MQAIEARVSTVGKIMEGVLKCRRCNGGVVRRSKRNLAEKMFLTLLSIRPYRCVDCGARFYHRAPSKE